MSLIAWFPLNKDTNLLPGLASFSVEGGVTLTADSDGWYKVQDSTHGSGGNWGIYYDMNVKPNTTYTLVVYSKSTTGIPARVRIGSYEGIASWPGVANDNTGDEKKVIYSFKTGGTHNVARLYLCMTCSGTKANDYVFFKAPTLREVVNQGLSDIGMKNNDVAYDSTGKIGGSYYFNASSYITENTYDWTNFNSTAFSLACWYKEPSPVASGNSQMICIGTSSGWNNIRIGLLRRTSNGCPMFSVSDGTNNVNYNFTADSFPLDTWNHIVCTYNNGTMKMYLNGILHKTYTTNITPVLNSSQHLGVGAASNGSEPLTGYLNDVRIYDHCLSAMEVKLLSQGLILHYPLNDPYIESGKNLCTVLTAGTGNQTWGDHSTVWTIEDATSFPIPVNQCMKAVHTYTNTGNWGGYSKSVQTISALPSTVYTFSCYMKVSDNFEYTNANFIYHYEYNSSGTKLIEGGLYNKSRMESMGDGWFRCWGTFTTQETTASINISFYSYAEKNTTHWVGGWQIEQNDHLTPFMTPGTNRNNNVVYDTSGYCYNGSASGTLTISNNTPKYSVSTLFNGAEYILRDSFTSEILTLSAWIKTSKNKSTSQFAVADLFSQICITIYSGCIIGYYGVGGSQGTGSRCTLGSSYKENDWNHIVVVKTGVGTRTIYCNGVELTPTSNDYWSANGPGFMVGARTTSLTLPFYGELSDVRAYTTALSADDVKALYKNSAYIDNAGNVYGVINEV